MTMGIKIPTPEVLKNKWKMDCWNAQDFTNPALGYLDLQEENNGEWFHVHNKIPIVHCFTDQVMLKSVTKDNEDNGGDDKNKYGAPGKMSQE
jgi:hypothetical protein